MHRCRLGAAHEHGLFVAPTVIELPRAAALTREVFGPVLHVVRYRAGAARRARRRDQRLGLRADARRAHAHRCDGESGRAACARRQRLREPQHDRRRRRRAAVRRHGVVRARARRRAGRTTCRGSRSSARSRPIRPPSAATRRSCRSMPGRARSAPTIEQTLAGMPENGAGQSVRRPARPAETLGFRVGTRLAM